MTEPIQMINLPAEYLCLKAEYDAAIEKVLLKGDFINGEAVKTFEESLSNYLGIKNIIACGNGTDALQIALMALNIGPGDEVIIPAFSYVSVIEVICLLGAQPVLVDVDTSFYQLDVSKVLSAINDKTKAIIPVHLFGQCGDLSVLLKIAQDRNLFIIEDCAQALGATYELKDEVRFLGGIGHIGCTSFFPTKNLGCFGDGGAIFTDDDALADKIRKIANHGQIKKYEHQLVGVNSRLDTIQAAILNVKLKYLDISLLKKENIASLYLEELKDIEAVELPELQYGAKHSWHQFTIKVKDSQRDLLKQFLDTKGIQSMIYYGQTLSQQVAYQKYKSDCPVAEDIVHTVLSLPIHDQLSKADVMAICLAIKEFFYGKS